MRTEEQLTRHSVAQKVLVAEYTRLAGIIFAEFYLRNSGDEEAQKSLKADDLLTALMTGKNIKEEWALEKTDAYKQFVNLIATINSLT